MTKRIRHLRRSALLAAATLAAAMTGCGDGDGSGLPDPPAPTLADPASTVDPVHQEILDVYYGSVDAMVAAQQVGDRDHPDLGRYFAEGTPAILNVQSGIQRNDARGTYYEGELEVIEATVTAIDDGESLPEATIESCLDDTNYQLVQREDGSLVPDTEPGGRYLVTSKAFFGTDDQWYIAETTAHWDVPC